MGRNCFRRMCSVVPAALHASVQDCLPGESCFALFMNYRDGSGFVQTEYSIVIWQYALPTA